MQSMILLVAHGADIESVTNDGSTALHYAWINDKGAEMIEHLLDRQVSVTVGAACLLTSIALMCSLRRSEEVQAADQESS